MAERCLIIAAGTRENIPYRAGDYVIACDQGYEYAKEQCVPVDIVLGDLDSYHGKIKDDVEIMRYPREKDDTDTMAAVRFAISKGYKKIVLTCALGGRLDHSLANIQAGCYAAAAWADFSILGENNRAFFIYKGEKKFPREEGWSLSVFAHDEKCRGVSIKGAKYALDNVTLTNNFPIGASNEWTADEVTVAVKEGVLVVVESRL